MRPLERTDSTLAPPQTTRVADKPLLADTVTGASPSPRPLPAAAPPGPGPRAVRIGLAHQEQGHGVPAMLSLHLQGRMSPEVTGHCPPKSMRTTLRVTATEPSLEEAQCETRYKPCPLNPKSCRRSQGAEEGDFAGCLGGDPFLPSARRTLLLRGLGSDMGWGVRRGSPRSQALGWTQNSQHWMPWASSLQAAGRSLRTHVQLLITSRLSLPWWFCCPWEPWMTLGGGAHGSPTARTDVHDEALPRCWGQLPRQVGGG